MTDVRQAAPQSELEPVAWMIHHNVALMPLFHHDKASAMSWGGGDPVPLYTSPPQRQPLTDEEIEELERWVEFKETGKPERIALTLLVRRVEAAHGIGGDK
jgi:hypothetical protein